MKRYLTLLAGILLVTTVLALSIDQTVTVTIVDPIIINEFTTDPQTDWDSSGSATSSDEWIELYNFGTYDVDLTGWTLILNDSTPETEFLTGILPKKTYLIILNPAGVINNDGQLILKDNLGSTVDSVTYGNHDDGNPADNALNGNANNINDECVSRLPNAIDTNTDINDFTKLLCTYGYSNNAWNISYTPINIQNLPTDPTCILQTDNITISADITGSIKEVTLFINTNGTWYNIVLPGSTEGIYSSIIPSTELTESSTIYWKFLVKDIFDDMTHGTEQNIYIHPRTLLSISPPTPDGNPPWYISQPVFTLTNPDATQLFYRWDSANTTFNTPAPFGLENAPNNANITGGIQELNYWSDICTQEPTQTILFNFDFFSPEIKDENPANNSTTDITNPIISAVIDDKYGTNSGIDLTSIIMKLDNIAVNAVYTQLGTLKYKASFQTANLTSGNHTVELTAGDIAGNPLSHLNWTFEVTAPEPFNLTLTLPINNSNHSDRKILFNIKTNYKVEIEYKDLNDNNPRFKRLCRNCEEYNSTKSFKDGPHSIIIQAVDNSDILGSTQRTFFVDSKAPKIHDFSPEQDDIIPGSTFTVEYTEDYLEKIELYWKTTTEQDYTITPLQNCQSGRRQTCEIELNLSNYNEQQIEFFFNISDRVFSTTSDLTTVTVDNDLPVITLNNPVQNQNHSSKKVFLDIKTDEPVYELEYKDLNDNNPKFKRLCRNCEEYNKTKTFKDGNNNIIIRAVDYVGHSSEISADFFVDSTPPKIRKILPKDNSLTNGTIFSVEYDEENLKDIKLILQNSTGTTEISLTNCQSGRRQTCEIEQSLKQYDGEQVQFYFTISDPASETTSSKNIITVDSMPPTITINKPINSTIFNNRRIELDIELTEPALLKYKDKEYKDCKFDLNDKKCKWRTLCRNCGEYIRTRTFSEGPHNLIIKAEDKAGNAVIEQVSFEIIL